jgi:hypothetical protein
MYNKFCVFRLDKKGFNIFLNTVIKICLDGLNVKLQANLAGPSRQRTVKNKHSFKRTTRGSQKIIFPILLPPNNLT